jgi:hypothetical protein
MTLRRSLQWPTAWLAAACFAILLLLALPGAARAQSERTTGDWQQYVFADGAWRGLGVYRVALSDGGDYGMDPVSQSQDPGVTTSKGLSNVKFSDGAWRFSSDWGNGDVGEFRLQRIAPGLYAGWSYLRKEKRNLNLWVLIR